MKELWTEKYRPTNIKGYVFRDEKQRDQVKAWLSDGALPHLLFSGAPGTGKTTLAKVLLNELNINPMDILMINASSERGIDVIRNKITKFGTTLPFGDMKYVIFDEADYVTDEGQAALRGVMEAYASTCRFILTCNRVHMIIPAIQSRCQGFHIEKLDLNEFTARIAEIGISENVKFDLDTLDTYVQATYPDLRKCINLIQQNVVDGELKKPTDSDYSSTSEWMISVVELFKNGEFKKAREIIVTQAKPEEYEEVYRFMYRNLDLWGDTDAKQDQAIVIIRDGMVKSVSCADPEINLSATLIELQLNSM